METKSKDELLLTPMNEFYNLGEPFTKCFEREKRGRDYKIPTLAQFIELNPFLKYDSDDFHDFGGELKLFSRKSTKWEKLKKFLLDNGFTTDDWAMLLPKTEVSGRSVDDFSVLSKNQILKLPIQTVCPGKSTHHMDHMTVADVLKLDLSYTNSSNFVVQRKLRQLGFTEKDGEIMKIRNPKTQAFHIKYLIDKRGFSEEEAKFAFEIGIKAGWIRV